MLRANHAVRLGLRAASRNPELAFVKALLDQCGNLLALLPLALAALLIAGADNLAAMIRLIRALPWSMAGGLLAAIAIAFVAGSVFWSGALPLLAADAEMDRRPPAGNFALLASRGFGRVVLAALAAGALSLLVILAFSAALAVGVPAIAGRLSVGLLAGVAVLASVFVIAAVMVDLLARLMLVRAAAFGDSASSAFGRAASLLGSRLGACLIVTGVFLLLELIAASVAGLFTGLISSTSMFDPGAEMLALAPRIAAGLAFAAVFAWLEVGRMGALAAIAADAEGLIEPPPAGPVLIAEPVIEALPVPDQE